MKRMIKAFLTVSIFFTNITLFADYSDKNFMLPRDQISNLALKHSTWHTFFNKKPDGKYSGTIQISPFYQKSNNKTDIGKFFGFINEKKDNRRQNYIGVDPTDNTEYLLLTDDIIHNFDQTAAKRTLNARIKFEPYQTVYGVRLDYHQDLDELLNGLFFQINTPLVHVKTNMNLSDMKTGEQGLPIDNGDLSTTKKVTLGDYFAGNVENAATTNLQEKLKYAKMAGSQSTGGLADVEIDLGYQLFFKKNFRLSFNGAVLVPTGNRPKAEYRFEPIYGSAGHWAIGAGLDIDLCLWKKEDTEIKLMAAADYKYYFKSVEKRTPSFKGADGNKNAENIYKLGGEKGRPTVFPLANALTQDLHVEPGSQIDCIFAICFNFKRIIFDIGYNCFAREAEEINLKHAWNNYQYAVAAYEYNTTNKFEIKAATADLGTTGNAIKDTEIDLMSVTQPRQTTHKFYTAIAYENKEWKYPYNIGVGGSYEFAESNSALEGWALWLKGNLAF